MKNIYTFIFSFFLLGICTSCKNDFLDLTPQSDVSTKNFYKTSADIQMAVNAVYANNQSSDLYFGNLVYLLETRSDNMVDLNSGGNSGREYAIDNFTESADNYNLQYTWSVLYAGIFKANIVLENIDAIKIDASLKERFKGEVRFLRALNYFHLVRLWGNVPLVLNSISPLDAYNLKRDAITEVYKTIEDDLKFAASILPSTYPSAELGRITKGAANGLLGKVYLTERKYPEAKTALEAVINEGTFKLLPKIASVFDIANEYNSEILFAVRFSKLIGSEGHLLNTMHSAQYLNIDPKLLAAYGTTDERRNVLNVTKVSASVSPVNKFYDVPNGTQYGNDFPVLRYADVLLMYAEVLNELDFSVSGIAFNQLNAVRIRAGASPYIKTDLADQKSFRTAVYLERRLEFPLEEQRWYDLLRTNTASDAIQAIGGNFALNFKPKHLLYAIPKSEIEKINNPTNFPQNPGY